MGSWGSRFLLDVKLVRRRGIFCHALQEPTNEKERYVMLGIVSGNTRITVCNWTEILTQARQLRRMCVPLDHPASPWIFGPGNGSLTLTHLVVLLLVVVVVVVVLGLTLFEKSLRLLHFLFKFLQISSHNPL